MADRTGLSIGNFDGAHRGHRALIRAAREAVGAGGRVVVLTFEPHPMTILRPDATPARLARPEQRRRWLLDAGADEVVALEPTRELLGRTPEQFMQTVVSLHRPDVVVEGPDFRFGRDRAGTVETLRELGVTMGFAVRVIDPVEVPLVNQHVVRVSSSIIRWLVHRGRVSDAAMLLGRPFELVGAVVPGDRKGRELSMPTANLAHEDLILPADGVYAGRGRGPDGQWFPAAISVGTKPTFGDRARTCEAHLVGFDGPVDDYGWELHLQFSHWLREQLACSSVDALVRRMQSDVEQTLRVMTASPSVPQSLGS